jgi:hypothetical protein
MSQSPLLVLLLPNRLLSAASPVVSLYDGCPNLGDARLSYGSDRPEVALNVRRLVPETSRPNWQGLSEHMAMTAFTVWRWSLQ